MYVYVVVILFAGDNTCTCTYMYQGARNLQSKREHMYSIHDIMEVHIKIHVHVYTRKVVGVGCVD